MECPGQFALALVRRTHLALVTALLLVAALAMPSPARAGSTGTTALFKPAGNHAVTSDGDFVSSNQGTGLNSPYHYFVEVPPGLSRLRIQIFDADIGEGGAGESPVQRDRARTAFNTIADYSVFDPTGTKITTTLFGTGTATLPALADDGWLTLYDSTVAPSVSAVDTATAGTGNAGVATSIVITRAAVVPVAGNLLVAVITVQGTAGGNLTAPAGFTVASEGNCGGAPDCHVYVGWKLATGAEPATYTFTWTTAAQAAAALVLIVGNDTTTPINASGAAASVTANVNPTAPSIPTSGSELLLLEAYGEGGNVTLTSVPAGTTQKFDQASPSTTDTVRVRESGASIVQATGVATTAGQFTISGARNWRAVTLAVNPATPPAPIAGHWEVRIDMSTGANGGTNAQDLNAFGLQADDGGAGGGHTELNVYADSATEVGANPDPAGVNHDGSVAYTLFPYITTCSPNENDFDYDSDQADAQGVGSVKLTSRTGAYTITFPSASLSANDTWTRNSVPTSSFTTDANSTDYGIWEADVTINGYGGGADGNYSTIYFGNNSAAANPPALNTGGALNPMFANTFRIYFPTSSSSTAPVKPYLEQEARYEFLGGLGGPNPPVKGQTTINQISVQVVNPTSEAINFSATNLVTVNVPGAGAVFGGNAVVTQGSAPTTPGVGATGNITWDPGTVAAGTTALLTYEVKITPTAAGQRIPVVGTVASGNGTKGVWVDETGNTTQARAKTTFGPLCELAATAGLISPVVVSDVHARRGDRGVEVEWDTHSEVGSVTFDLMRWDRREDRYLIVNERPVSALTGATQGGHYRVLDAASRSDGTERYMIIEHVATARLTETRSYGPFDLPLENASANDSESLPDEGFARIPNPLNGRTPEERADATRDFDADNSAITKSGFPVTFLRIGVPGPGLYFVPAQTIASQFGLSLPVAQSLIASRQLDLVGPLGETAWFPSSVLVSDAPGLLFYGQAPVGIYSADAIYHLSMSPGTWMPVSFLTGKTGAPGASFYDTIHLEQDMFAATVVTTNPDSNYWYWLSFSAGDPQFGTQSVQLQLPAGVQNTVAQTAHLVVHLQGASATGVAGEHNAIVSLNGVQIGTVQWTGVTPASADLPFNGTLLVQGANTVQIQAVLGSGAPFSQWYLQSFDLSYERLYQTTSNSLLVRADNNPWVTVSGFSGTRIFVFDLTNPARPVFEGGGQTITAALGGGFQASFKPNTAQTPYYLVTPPAWKTPDYVLADASIPLRNPQLGANYLVIAPQSLLSGAQELAEYRAQQGLKTMVLDVQNVYDVFSAGVPSPHAIHDFLAYATTSWSLPPRYVVLAGLGTYDYKNYLGLGGNLLPPLMISTAYGLFASDNAIADARGDGIPDVAIGRLPITSNSALHSLVLKMKAYEGASPGSWSAQSLYVADTGFSADSDVVAGMVPPSRVAQRLYLDNLPAATVRNSLLASLTSGIGLLNYVGHGGLDRLSGDGLLVTGDVASLTNGAFEPVVSALTCTINRFEVPGFQPLGAALVSQPNGGAAAVWAPTGISMSDEAKLLGQQFYLELGRSSGSGPQRLGDVVLRALQDYGRLGDDPEMAAIYQLLADPALLIVAAPGPVAGGNKGGPAE